MPSFEKFEKVVRLLYDSKIAYDKLVDEMPGAYSSIIIEDDYVGQLLHTNDRIIELMYPEHAECLGWFLWEWRPGYTIGVDGTDHIIADLDGYLTYKKEFWVEQVAVENNSEGC